MLGWAAARAYRRSLLQQGFCGAPTTSSTFRLELLQMLDDARAGMALAYAAASLALGLAAAELGRRAASPESPAAPPEPESPAADGVSLGVWIGIGLLGGLGAVARVLGAAVDADAYAFAATGFLGAFTTFSTWVVDAACSAVGSARRTSSLLSCPGWSRSGRGASSVACSRCR